MGAGLRESLSKWIFGLKGTKKTGGIVDGRVVGDERSSFAKASEGKLPSFAETSEDECLSSTITGNNANNEMTTAYPVEKTDLGEEENAGLNEKPVKNLIPAKAGRLPGRERFFLFLKAAGRGKRTGQEYGYDLKWWNARTGGKGNGTYELGILEMERILAPLHPSTRQRKIAVLKTYARWLLREGHPRLYGEIEKLAAVKKRKALPKDLGPLKFLELRELAKTWVREGRREGIWAGFMLLGGLRISEIHTTRLLDDGRIKILGKGSKERIVPLPAWLIDAAARIPRDGQRGWSKQRAVIWSGLAKEGIRQPHSLRHTYASELLRRGRTIEEIQILLGHESVATTGVYARISRVPDVAADLER
jgi:integrase/recombinase XerD